VRIKPVLYLALILSVGYAAYTQAENVGTNTTSGQIYRDDMYGFQITLPKGWMAKEVGHEQDHYGYAFLTINNQRQDLDCGDGWWAESGWNFHGRKTELQSNEVYMCIGYDGGPILMTMSTDTVGHDLGSLMATNAMRLFSAKGSAYYALNFFKRGQVWSIAVDMKEPVTEQNREDVMSILQSFRFLDGRIHNANWAEALAWNRLPPGERASGSLFGWPAVGMYNNAEEDARMDSRSVVVKKMDSGYSVKFARGQYFPRNWEFYVFADGKVVQRANQQMYHWKAIGKCAGISALILAAFAGLLFTARTVRV
jgi:hypothetical protein